MIVFVICFLLQVFLFVKIKNRGYNILILALIASIILPPVIWVIVSAILDGYMEGLFEGLGYVFFSYLHILVICVLLIVKGARTMNTKYSFIGVVTIVCLAIVFLFLINLLKGTSFKIGG